MQNASAFPRKPSGIYGETFFDDNVPMPDERQSHYIPDCEVVVQNAKTHALIKTFRSNPKGQFKVDLPPGHYVVFPKEPSYAANFITRQTEVTVWAGFYSYAHVSFDNGF